MKRNQQIYKTNLFFTTATSRVISQRLSSRKDLKKEKDKRVN